VLEATSTLVRSPRPLTATVDDEIVMLSPDRGAYFGLNAVASRIWSLLGEPVTIDALCVALTAEYQVDELTCRREVLAFLRELDRAELVEIIR